MRPVARVVLVLVVVAPLACRGLAAQEAAGDIPPEAFQGEQIEYFLAHATITGLHDDLDGITAPRRATLELDGVSHDAVFKTIDVDRPGITREENVVFVDFADRWQAEVAAYQIDRVIGLGMVPATVERTHRGERGSLQWWVESEMSEALRQQNEIDPPDPAAWALQQLKLWLFDNLIYNTDRHSGNVLITKDFRIFLIDHSRAFRRFDQLMAPDILQAFSRSLLAGLQLLDRDDLRMRIGAYVTNPQIDALLKRRDAILAQAGRLVAERGEDAVLYP